MTIESAKMIPAMTQTQARFVINMELNRRWSDGELNCDHYQAVAAADGIVDRLYESGLEDDLDLAEEPLDVISEVLRSHQGEDPEETAVAVYESLIDAGLLPGVNAQRVGEADLVEN